MAPERSGKAIAIDGAFSEAYGHHGFTLFLEADRTVLAKHHHFESVDAVVRDGVDITMLERLLELYRNNHLRQDDWRQAVRS